MNKNKLKWDIIKIAKDPYSDPEWKVHEIDYTIMKEELNPLTGRKWVIKSLTDTDVYKLNMMCVNFHRTSDYIGRWEFKCRNLGVKFTQEMVDAINLELDHLCTLKFTPEEIGKIRDLYWLTPKVGFLAFLRLFQFDRKMIYARLENDPNFKDPQLKITAIGPNYMISYFETFVLSIVTEIYYGARKDIYVESFMNRLDKKIDLILENKIKFSEFGARRRISYYFHDICVERLSRRITDRNIFTGTSDMHFAFKYGLTPQGTMAHEFLCLGQALDNVTVEASQRHMLQQWADEFRGNLGIALSDNLGIDKFLVDFDLYFAKLFNGVRQDSGDPYEVANKVINHYKKLGIDPRTKTIVFSDCLNVPKAIDLNNTFKDKINVAFGIGTNLVCDCAGIDEPLQCVMKLVEVNNKPVAKISDSYGKVMCEDQEYINYINSVIRRSVENG